jgi:DNA adenine methylase
MKDSDHRRLAKVLRNVKGKVAISGYRGGLMDELYDGWRVVDGPEKKVHSIKGLRQESLWVNYELDQNDEGQEWQPHQQSLI